MQNSQKYSTHIQIMIKACQKGAAAIARDFLELEQLQSSQRDLKEFANKVDQKAENTIIGELKRARAEYGIYAEESPEVIGNGKFRWIIDPIDGTSNFSHGHPNYAISIALEKFGVLQVNPSPVGYIVAGVIYLPHTKEIYWSDRDGGAYYIDPHGYQNKLKVSAGLDRHVVGTIIPHKPSSHYDNVFDEIRRIGAKIRISGSIAMDLAYVASGRLDYLFLNRFNLWDIAAGCLLVTEAGGSMTYKDGIFSAGGNGFMSSLEKQRKDGELIDYNDAID